MYELWGRKRSKDGIGYPYEFISKFYGKEQVDYMISSVDKEEYQEVMIVSDNHLVKYVEFHSYKPMKLTRRK